VVGGTIDHNFENRAFLWKRDKMIDLNDLIPPNTGWTLMAAQSINNKGLIVGNGYYAPMGVYRAFLLMPDQSGGFQVYGTGCAGSQGFKPGLYGEGCPTSKGDISLVAINGLGGSSGMLLFGGGKGSALFNGCDIQIMPLMPLMIPITLQGSGAGAGAWQIESQLPSGLLPVTIFLQALLEDPGGPAGFTITPPLEMEIY